MTANNMIGIAKELVRAEREEGVNADETIDKIFIKEGNIIGTMIQSYYHQEKAKTELTHKTGGEKVTKEEVSKLVHKAEKNMMERRKRERAKFLR